MKLFGKKKQEEKDKAVLKTTQPASGKKIKSAKAETDQPESMKDLYDGTAKSQVKTAKKEVRKSKSANAYKILVRPLVTEKVSHLGAVNKYVFEVANGANKIEVARAINEVYGIKPIKVNMIKLAGKKSRWGRISGQRANWKKAIITLPAGQTIKVYEGV